MPGHPHPGYGKENQQVLQTFSKERKCAQMLYIFVVKTHLCNLVKFPEELIQHVDEFPRGAVTCKSGEPNDVSI